VTARLARAKTIPGEGQAAGADVQKLSTGDADMLTFETAGVRTHRPPG